MNTENEHFYFMLQKTPAEVWQAVTEHLGKKSCTLKQLIETLEKLGFTEGYLDSIVEKIQDLAHVANDHELNFFETDNKNMIEVAKKKANLLDQICLIKADLCLMHELDAMVPEGEGAVSLTIYSDGSSRMNLEMWGATVAKKAEGQPFVLDTHAIQTQNPDWMPALEKLVEKLNTRQSK